MQTVPDVQTQTVCLLWYKPTLRTYCQKKTSSLQCGALCEAEYNYALAALTEEKSLCLHCDLGETEDEIHLMFYCSLYDD